MKFGFKILLIASIFLVCGAEAKLQKLAWNGFGTSSMYGCSEPLTYSVTFCNETLEYFECFCINENALASVVGCLRDSNALVSLSIKAIKTNCKEYGGTIVTDDDIDKAVEYYDEKGAYMSDIPDFSLLTPVTQPVKLDDDVRELWHRAYLNWLIKNYDDPVWYSLMLVWWFTLVMVVATFVNLTKKFCPGMYQRFTGPISNTFRKYVLLPALIGKNKNQEVSWLGKTIYMLVPLRWESCVIVVFVALNFVVLFADLHYVKGDPIFLNKKNAFNRYEATRSGIAGTMLTPLLVYFAGRNNVLLWLTGWNYATNITFHKWVSRIAFVQILVHSICYTVLWIDEGYYTEEMAENYLIWGTVGTAVMGLLVLQAILQFRRRWYETFVLLHVTLAVFYIIGCWYHLVELGYLQMIIPAIALWGFDRAARLVRMAIFGFPKASVTLLGNGNGVDPLTNEAATLKVLIPKPAHWRMTPGGHVWVYFLKPTCFWQSHPFTCIESLDGKSVMLFCKVKKGVTYNLFKYLLKSPTKQAQIRVCIEGPYTEPSQYTRTECISFIAGGNGIPGLYSEATHLAKKRGASNGSIKLHWIIRDYGSIMWFYDQLEALRNIPVETTIYLTRPSKSLVKNDSGRDSDKDVDEKKSKDSSMIDVDLLKANLPFITFVEGRPIVDDIIAEDIAATNKAVAFVSCGHPMMVDDVRQAVVDSLSKNEGKRIDFYEALQVWA